MVEITSNLGAVVRMMTRRGMMRSRRETRREGTGAVGSEKKAPEKSEAD